MINRIINTKKNGKTEDVRLTMKGNDDDGKK